MEKKRARFPRQGPAPAGFSTLWKIAAVVVLGAPASGLEWAGWSRDTADHGILAPAQDLIVAVDSKPRGAATHGEVHIDVAGRATETRRLAHHGLANYDTHDRWQANLGRFPEGAELRYRIEVCGPGGRLPLAPVSVAVRNAEAPIRWIGNLRVEPSAPNAGDELRVSCEMQPAGVAVAAEVGFSTDDGESWQTAPMARAAPAGGHDRWAARLGGFPEGTEIRLYVRAQNARGDSFWDSNGGADYRVRVNSPIADVYPAKGRHAPGEVAHLTVELQNPGAAALAGTLLVRIRDLHHELAAFRRTVALPAGRRQSLVFPWKTPARDFRGYGVDVDLRVDGRLRDSRSTAVDVSSDWTRFPRYGFFCEYPAGDDAAGKSAELAKFHLNAIQFYDWKWTHDRLVPVDADGRPLNVFTQVGGRVQSFETVRDKVAAVQARGMAALSYNLMYGDSGAAAPERIEWAAFQIPHATRIEQVRTHSAGAYPIWVMDVSNPEWKRHIFAQFREALTHGGFDGIHLDNLGRQHNYQYHSEAVICERDEFPRFIRECRAFLRQSHPAAVVLHNDVKSDHLEEIARSEAAVYYAEIWTRDTYRELAENIREVQTIAPGKAVVFAAYINRRPWDEITDPTRPPLPTFINDASAKLLDACLFAQGAFHIELGEDGQMLVNEYFPARSPRLHPGLKRALRSYYDVLVRYQNLLADNVRPSELRVASPTHPLSDSGAAGAIWTVARQHADGTHILHLINLVGVKEHWRHPQPNPRPQTQIALRLRGHRLPRRGFFATPDDGLGRPRPLSIARGRDAEGDYLSLQIPRLDFWNLLVLTP